MEGQPQGREVRLNMLELQIFPGQGILNMTNPFTYRALRQDSCPKDLKPTLPLGFPLEY